MAKNRQKSQQDAMSSTKHGERDATSYLEFQLLGTNRIVLNSRDLTDLGSRKAQALLFYLAMMPGYASRDTLANLLWPEKAEHSAKNNLRTTIANLNRYLALYLDTSSSGIAFRHHLPHGIDAEILPRRLNTAMDHCDLEAIRSALELYRGEFLQGFHVRGVEPFQEWMLQQRESLHLLVLRGLVMLADLCIAQGEYSVGIGAGRRLLDMEPWSEVAHRQMMTLLALSGHRVQALRQFDVCRQVLGDELDIGPAQETVILYEQIRTGTFVSSGLQLPNAQPEQAQHRRLADWTGDLRVDSSIESTIASGPSVEHRTIPHNLITPLATFIGRETELALIRQRLLDPNCRLLTITGPGGMGKTSLALQVGRQLLESHSNDFPDGIFIVSLANVNLADVDHIAQETAPTKAYSEAILQTIAEQLNADPIINLSSTAQLNNYLRSRRLLLILDNFEHLLDETDTLISLLTTAPYVKALVTSRARLNIRGETVFILNKLSLPDIKFQSAEILTQTHVVQLMRDEAWRQSEALVMFAQRAKSLCQEFIVDTETIGPMTEICYLVDGLPLGIELATGMLPGLSCRELAAMLSQKLDILETHMRDMPSGHFTLRAVFEHSWKLLSTVDQELLARLSIFPGAFDHDAASYVAGASIVQLKRLIDQSLLTRVGDTHYTLHRTIHEFAQRKLQQVPEQIEAIEKRYAHYYLQWLARLEQEITGAGYNPAAEQIRSELDNVYAAWNRAVAYQMSNEINRCLQTLLFFYEQHGFYLDIYRLIEHALAQFDRQPNRNQHSAASGREDAITDNERNVLIGHLQAHLAFYSVRLGQLQQADALYKSSISKLQLHRDDAPYAAIFSFSAYGSFLKLNSPERSTALLTEALHLAQANGIRWWQVYILQLLAENDMLNGQYDAAETKLVGSISLADQMNMVRGLIGGYRAMARVDRLRGRYGQAEERLHQSISLASQHHNDVLHIELTIMLGEALRLQGRFDEATKCFTDSQKRMQALGVTEMFKASILWEEGCLAEQCGAYEKAKDRLTKSLEIGLSIWWAHALPSLGWAIIGLGELDEACSYFRKVLQEAEAKERLPIVLDAQLGLAYADVLSAQIPLSTQTEEPSYQQFYHASRRCDDMLQRIHQNPGRYPRNS